MKDEENVPGVLMPPQESSVAEGVTTSAPIHRGLSDHDRRLLTAVEKRVATWVAILIPILLILSSLFGFVSSYSQHMALQDERDKIKGEALILLKTDITTLKDNQQSFIVHQTAHDAAIDARLESILQYWHDQRQFQGIK